MKSLGGAKSDHTSVVLHVAPSAHVSALPGSVSTLKLPFGVPLGSSWSCGDCEASPLRPGGAVASAPFRNTSIVYMHDHVGRPG